MDGSLPEELDPEYFGLPRAIGDGKWASCIRLLSPFSGDTLSFFELDNNEAAISVTLCRFAAHAHESLLVVGTVTEMTLAPRSCKTGSLRVYRFIDNGNALELYHHVNFIIYRSRLR